MYSCRKRFCAALVAVALAGLLCSLAPPALAYPAVYDGQWRSTFVPYLWGPTINGTLNLKTAGGTGGGGAAALSGEHPGGRDGRAQQLP